MGPDPSTCFFRSPNMPPALSCSDFSVGFCEGPRNADGEQVLEIRDTSIAGITGMMGRGSGCTNCYQPGPLIRAVGFDTVVLEDVHISNIEYYRAGLNHGPFWLSGNANVTMQRVSCTRVSTGRGPELS